VLAFAISLPPFVLALAGTLAVRKKGRNQIIRKIRRSKALIDSYD
jgi:heme exporter protein D